MITLLAIIGFVAVFPVLALLGAGLFYWMVGTLLAGATMIVRGVTGGVR